MNYFGPAAIALALSLVLTGLVRRLALKLKIVDQADSERKIHQGAMPLLGGLAIFFAYFVVLFLVRRHLISSSLPIETWLGFFSGALILVIGGILDDKYNLRPTRQIIFPILAIVAIILGGVSIAKISNPFGGLIILSHWPLLSPLLVAVWLLGMMYTTKLLDGVDGLVGGLSGIGGLVIFLFTITTRYYQPDIALASIILTAVCLGFLYFNFNPARIFLGEAGSLLLGYILGVLAIISGGKIAIALLVMGIPILDVAWTIVRRLASGRNPFRSADRQHLHHRLLDLGLSQKQTVLIFYLMSLVFGLSGLFLQSQGKFWALMVLLLIMLGIIIFFSYWRRPRSTSKSKLLLHICCAPCGAYWSQEILSRQYDLTFYFYNSNLNSKEEYDKRLACVRDLTKRNHWPLIIEPYDHESWQKKICGLEYQPERGERCQICIDDRLLKTALLAKKKGFKFFATTLSVSPYKDQEFIRRSGRRLAAAYGLDYIEPAADPDFYRKSQALAKELGIYRQKFCGCGNSLKVKK